VEYEVVNAGKLSSLWASVDAAPGGTSQYTVNVLVRRGGTSTSQLSCTITGTQRACEATGSFALLTGDRVEVQINNTIGSPASGKWKTYVTIS
jgi:hypothetical protein